MTIKLGDRGPQVRAWRRAMNLRFGGAYARARGPLPDTDEFGPRARSWQQEYELRTNQFPDGEVSDNDLRALKITTPSGPPPGTKPVLFTVHGSGQPDPTGPGLPADTARACLDKCDWQAIGNYSAAPFPMWPAILQARAELNVQIDRYPNRKIRAAGYSEGAVGLGQFLKHDVMDPAGKQHHRLKDFEKVVFWGNPMRQQGIAHFDEWIWPIAPPATSGILEDRLEGLESAPFEVRDYAHAGDMYASCGTDLKSQDKRAIAKLIMFDGANTWNGPDSIIAQLTELASSPIPGAIGIFGALIDTITFFAGNAHGYNIGPAIDFLRS